MNKSERTHYLDRPGNGQSLWDFWVRTMVTMAGCTERLSREFTFAAEHDGVAYISPSIANGKGRYAESLRDRLTDPGQPIEEGELFDLFQQNAWDEEDLFGEFTEILRLEMRCAIEAGDDVALSELFSELLGEDVIAWTEPT